MVFDTCFPLQALQSPDFSCQPQEKAKAGPYASPPHLFVYEMVFWSQNAVSGPCKVYYDMDAMANYGGIIGVLWRASVFRLRKARAWGWGWKKRKIEEKRGQEKYC